MGWKPDFGLIGVVVYHNIQVPRADELIAEADSDPLPPPAIR
jgi:hypothetical protein